MFGTSIPLLTQLMTPDLVAKMAAAAGISDAASARKTMSGAVPAILSELVNLVSKPNGARQLSDVVAKQPQDLLENLAGMGGGLGQLINIGRSTLTSLFGGNTLGSLTSALSRYGGVSEGAVQSLLAMLTPMILGVLGRQAGAGAGAGALAQLLMSHKDKIAGDIPPGLSDLLKSRDTAEEHVSASSAAPSRISDAYRAPRSSVGDAAHAASSSGAAPASARWAYWALPAVAVGLLAWYFLGEERTPQPIAKGPSQSSLPTAQGSISDTDVQRRITAALDSLDGTLKGAKDSPLLALPQLQQTSGELDRLSEMANRLPVESRERIAEGIKAAIARLKTALDNVDATPGATGDVKPVVAALRAKLEALGRTPGSLAQQRPGLVVEREAFLARSPSGAFLMSGYVDRSVHNRLGERIGTVSDIVMAPDTTIAAALISVGSFLGIGDKEVAVPFAAIEVVRRDNDWLLVVDTTKEALRGAPTFEDTAARMRLPPRGSNPR